MLYEIILPVLIVWGILGLIVTGLNVHDEVDYFHEEYNWKQKLFIFTVGGPLVFIIGIIGYIIFGCHILYGKLLIKLEDKIVIDDTNDKEGLGW